MLASEKTTGGGQQRDRREKEKEKYWGEGTGGDTSTKFCMIRDQSQRFFYGNQLFTELLLSLAREIEERKRLLVAVEIRDTWSEIQREKERER